MRRFIAGLALYVALAAPGSAQEGYASTCDPNVQFECTSISMSYTGVSFGTPQFPDDPERADALIRMGLDGAYEGCANGAYNQCYSLSDFKMRLADTPATGRYSDIDRISAYLNFTETGCRNGDAEACYWRSVAFPQYMPAVVDIGLAMEMAKGLSKPQAEQVLLEESRRYSRLILATAQPQIAALRPACAAKTENACANLGELLKDNKVLRETPFEHLRFLFEGCAQDSPRACNSLKHAVSTLGVTQPSKPIEDPVRARWIAALTGACEKGDASMCQVLADLARPNSGLDRDIQTKIACDAGSGKSCTKIARTHLRDFDTFQDVKDLQSATELLTTACALDHNPACHILEHLSKG